MEPHRKKIKICVVTTNRSDYGRMKPIMEEMRRESGIELQVVAGTHLFFDYFFWYLRHGEPLSFWRSLPWFIKARLLALFNRDGTIEQKDQLMRLLIHDGFPIHARLPLFLEGGNPRVMTKMVGFCLIGLPDIFQKLAPDIVLINGDRFEMLPIAFAAVSSNIFLAHIEGGDVSGTLDESTRHAITKLAHIHFPATEKSAERIRRMGEPEELIFTTGSPVIDALARLELSLDNSFFDRRGLPREGRIDLTQPYLLILQHPVTTRYEKNKSDMEELIAAVRNMPVQKFFLSPNIDAGSDGVSFAIREYRAAKPRDAAFFKYFPLDDYYRLLAHAVVAVGNSSSFIREGAFLGTPAVIVGDRQQGRERGRNARDVVPERRKIAAAVREEMAHGPYPRDFLFGDGASSRRIVAILRNLDFSTLSLQKKFAEGG
jgi:UDP-hydrolysing UDP-N-acetyl-D-glucosamine 2-epimerase